jgi:hypothetical protein
MRRSVRGTVAALAAGIVASAGLVTGVATAAHADPVCTLQSPSGAIQHVISIQFDNVHFTRDNPNVPSDLEQMPNLLGFLESNGTLLTNHHTPLISHTGNDILTTLTGVYGDRHGVPVANSYKYWLPNGKVDTGLSFAYWTDPLADPAFPNPPSDSLPNMLSSGGLNAPAPWVPFTRAGCNVGQVATANTVLENLNPDVPDFFGVGSPQDQERLNNPDQASADFVGIGVHCAAGATLCSSANGGVADKLSDEPGGYTGYQTLIGNAYVAPQISPGGPMTDLDGNVIQSPQGYDGFPGFDGMSASVSLSYVAAMQEHGVPITYAYISDAHDAHPNGPDYGPGEAGYEAALHSYDNAFGEFFTRLANDGINSSNTLFVITADENDHFVGGPASPAGCDGVNTPCTYTQKGEVDGQMTGLLATETGDTTQFAVHSDSAPTVYVTGNPAPNDPSTRQFERDLNLLWAKNPITGQIDAITHYMADPVEERILHMVTADPKRTPTLTLFGNENYFLFTGAPNCSTPCVSLDPKFGWNHGDVDPDITTTWLGLVGPGVQNLGVDGQVWSDHTDIRPTILALTGLTDDYVSDGRVLSEVLDPSALPLGIAGNQPGFEQLAAAYKQLNACVGQFGLDSLAVDTEALTSATADDLLYTKLESKLAALGAQRDVVASKIRSLLNAAGFNGSTLSASTVSSYVKQANALLKKMHKLAS